MRKIAKPACSFLAIPTALSCTFTFIQLHELSTHLLPVVLNSAVALNAGFKVQACGFELSEGKWPYYAIFCLFGGGGGGGGCVHMNIYIINFQRL
jgi:hypothetical protein